MESKLSLEKQFQLADFNQKLDKASREQAIEIAKSTFKLMLAREQLVSELMKNSSLKGESWI
jgi:hypothetical protein